MILSKTEVSITQYQYMSFAVESIHNEENIIKEMPGNKLTKIHRITMGRLISHVHEQISCHDGEY